MAPDAWRASRVTLDPLRQQLRLKALRLRDPLDLDRDCVDGLLEMKQPIVVRGRAGGEALGAHEEQSRRDADADEAAHSGYNRGAYGGEGDYIRIHDEWGTGNG